MKLLFMDVDGTLTDGKIHISNSGELFKSFDVKDGYAIGQMMPGLNIIPVIITGRESEIVTNRAKELGITEIYQGCSDKKSIMMSIAKKYGLYLSDQVMKIPNTMYLGDDIPDLECIKIAEISGCPFDAVDAVKSQCQFVGEKRGGDGFVREFVEYIRRNG